MYHDVCQVWHSIHDGNVLPHHDDLIDVLWFELVDDQHWDASCLQIITSSLSETCEKALASEDHGANVCLVGAIVHT